MSSNAIRCELANRDEVYVIPPIPFNGAPLNSYPFLHHLAIFFVVVSSLNDELDDIDAQVYFSLSYMKGCLVETWAQSYKSVLYFRALILRPRNSICPHPHLSLTSSLSLTFVSTHHLYSCLSPPHLPCCHQCYPNVLGCIVLHQVHYFCFIPVHYM
jgi:hypothetical protein